ncbi:hypothetical protein DXA61_09355 [Bacteroides intestinalis]|nr:hypothetical protein DXA61_09355 [Bacteroides intestinalis]
MCVKICKNKTTVRIIIRIDINDIFFKSNNLVVRRLYKQESICKIIFIKHLAHSKNTFYLCAIKRTISEHFQN